MVLTGLFGFCHPLICVLRHLYLCTNLTPFFLISSSPLLFISPLHQSPLTSLILFFSSSFFCFHSSALFVLLFKPNLCKFAFCSSFSSLYLPMFKLVLPFPLLSNEAFPTLLSTDLFLLSVHLSSLFAASLICLFSPLSPASSLPFPLLPLHS